MQILESFTTTIVTVCCRAGGAQQARHSACAEIQPTRAAPGTARAYLVSVGHPGPHTSSTSAAPNGLQLLGEVDVQGRGT